MDLTVSSPLSPHPCLQLANLGLAFQTGLRRVQAEQSRSITDDKERKEDFTTRCKEMNNLTAGLMGDLHNAQVKLALKTEDDRATTARP